MIPDTYSDPASLPAGLRFLAGGGEATRLILARDWSAHPMGPPERWPDAFKATLSTVLNSPESMILCWGADELHFFFNATYIPLLGPRVGWAMGSTFREVWADALDQAMPIIADAFAGRSQRFDDLPWRLDTDRGPADTWFTFSYSRILDADGAVAGLFIFTNDTTARVLADAALREREERYRALFSAVEDGFCIIEFFDGPHGPYGDYVHVEANPGYARQTGIANVVGKTLREIAPGEADGWAQLYGDVLRTGRPLRFERAFETIDRVIEVSAARIEPASRRQVSVLFRDITPRKQAEAELRQLAETLEQRVAERTGELMRAEEQLRQAHKMEAVGQLTGGIAHDFNNMLTGVIGGLDLLKRHLAAGRLDRTDRYIDAATLSAQRAAGLTQRLLAFSRRQSLDVQPVDVEQVVVGMEELLRRTLGEQVGLEIRPAAGVAYALTDANQLESALLNLAINARDAMPDGGLLTIESENLRLDRSYVDGFEALEPGDYVVLSVSDTGTGMTADTVAKAFDPFFTTKPIGQGTGLGLSMIYGFVRQAGGHVRIYSEPGQGTSIKLYLRRHNGDAPLGHEVVHAAVEGGHGEQVLVVEDEPAVRMLIVEVLQDLGYRVLEAGDGREALKLIEREHAIDLLVTDVGLPGMNGRQLAELVRDRLPGLKVLFVTGYAEGAAVRSGFLDAGMDMIAKPFAIDALAAKISEMLGR